MSKMTAIKTGIPQGSVIGPLLYAVFTNKISEVVKKHGCSDDVHLDTSRLFGRQCMDCGVLTTYADDTTYIVANRHRRNNQESIIRTLEQMKVFLNDNRLAINLPKTECMLKQKKGRTPGLPQV